MSGSQTHGPLRFMALALVALMVLAGCISRPPSAPGKRQESREAVRPDPRARVIAAAAGSRYETALAPSDMQWLMGAMAQALSAPQYKRHLTWNNRRTGTSGSVEVTQAYLINVENLTGGRLWAPTGIDTRPVLEPAQGEYVADSKINVRLGPTTDAYKAEVLDPGTVVVALGREAARDWLLVARRGAVLGYVYAPLMRARSEDTLVLAGAAARRPSLCRDYRQTLTFSNGASDTWSGSACRGRDGIWRVVDDVLSFVG